MSRTTWSVPTEAIRHGVSIESAEKLEELAAQHAAFQPSTLVELTDGQFVASLVYRKPGTPDRIHHLHVALAWAPAESRR